MLQEIGALGFKQIDAIANTVNTNSYWNDMLELIAPEGSIGLIVEPSAPVDIAKMHRKSVRLVYELMFTRSLFSTSTMINQSEILNQIAQLIDSGKVQSTVSQVFDGLNTHNLKKMHALLETQSTIGKLVLKV
jgi:NADPH2:quinone reductase